MSQRMRMSKSRRGTSHAICSNTILKVERLALHESNPAEG